MKKIILLGSCLALLLAALAYAKTAPTAKADLTDSKGAKVGTAKLKDTPNGVSLALEVSNLPPGVHGFHIHAVGKCEQPDFKSAGGHFNPESKKHGWDNPEGHHAGDLQNLTVDAQGKAKVKVVVTGVTLGDGPNSLFQPQGTALVIHANPDDNKTDPAGNAGPRIACGVITR
jgi:Cu-Zn family superoxide dismutase